VHILRARRDKLIYWLPGPIAGLAAWFVFVVVGDTPIIRASGLALVIVGVTLTLRHMGALLAVGGGLALAFSPAFWSQTGGPSDGPAIIIIAAVTAFVTAVAVTELGKRPYLALGLGMTVFTIIFFSQVSTPRSLRLTGLLTAWLLFILVDSLRASNPRPDEQPPLPITAGQYTAMLVILMLGVLNDPLFVLLLPGVGLGLWLSNTPIPRLYWLALAGIAILGTRGIVLTYVSEIWWNVSALDAHQANLQVRFIIPDGWREGVRWVGLIKLIIHQFTLLGAALSVLGLARMARWRPVLGTVLMALYAFYAFFGLVYFGRDREILLVPLFIIQIIWLTYAAHVFIAWLEKVPQLRAGRPRWLVNGMYLVLPAYLLFSIVTSR
jgi:hypothetical protein